MSKNYLINLACYINTEQKRNWAIELIEHFKKENVDVCVGLHSSLYLSDIAQSPKFVYFDSDNTMVEESDFINNSDLIDENYNKYGIAESYTYYPNMIVYNNFLESRHSKAALGLLKNGLSVGLHQGYKWVVYTEYDVIMPAKGYVKLIEEKIERLEKENKDAFFYRVDKMHLGGIFGTLIIMKSDIILRSKLMSNDWYSSARNWIKHWGCSFFEKTVEAILVHDNQFKCIEDNIDEKCMDDWGKPRNDNFNKSGAVDEVGVKNTNIHRYNKKFNIHLYPYKINDSNEFKFCLYSSNYMDNHVDFFDINVFVDEVSVYNNKNIRNDPNFFYYVNIDTSIATPESKITLTGRTNYVKNIKYFEEFFLYKNVEKIHNKLLNIRFIA